MKTNKTKNAAPLLLLTLLILFGTGCRVWNAFAGDSVYFDPNGGVELFNPTR